MNTSRTIIIIIESKDKIGNLNIDTFGFIRIAFNYAFVTYTNKRSIKLNG